MKKEILLLFTLVVLPTISFARKSDSFTVYKTDSKVIYDICFTTKGGALGITDNNSVKVYSTKENVLLNEFRNGHDRPVLAIDISKDSTLLVSGGKDSMIVIWDFVNDKILRRLSYHKGIVTSVKFSPDGKYILSGGTGGKVFIYDIEKDEVTDVSIESNYDITSVKFNHDGRLIAIAGSNGLIYIHNFPDLTKIATLKGHNNWVRDIAFSNKGKKLLSCGDDSKVIEWDITKLPSASVKESFMIIQGWLLAVDIHSDGVTYASGCMDGRIRITTVFEKYKIKMGVPVNKVLFKPGEGNYIKILAATRGKGVILVDLAKAELD